LLLQYIKIVYLGATGYFAEYAENENMSMEGHMTVYNSIEMELAEE
jgi:osmotically-inducible protein OsmY